MNRYGDPITVTVYTCGPNVDLDEADVRALLEALQNHTDGGQS